ncbi:hypothetical protein K474DRAFT_1599602, partial [Panus rudis PR-1116 ss-1]
MSGKVDASVVRVPGAKSPPALTKGKLTPEVVNSWDKACRLYFARKAIAPADQVTNVATEFQDDLVLDWYCANETTLAIMTFTDFVAAFKARWLKRGWEDELLTKLIRHRQGENEPFEDWLTAIETQNAVLRGTSFHKDTAGIRELVAANAVEDLRLLAQKADVKAISDFQDWKDRLASRDNDRLRDIQARLREMDVYFNARSHANALLPARAQNATANSGGPAANTARVKLPKLTPAEKKLLDDNAGCYKCRKFYIYHQSPTCRIDFPDATTYRTLTAADAARAKEAKAKPTIGVVTEHNTSPIPIATIRSSPPLAISSSVLGSGEDTNSEYVTSSITAPHICWSASVVGADNLPSDPINMLIDCGSPTVLIDDSIVDTLGLRRRRLHTPLSLGGGGAFGTEAGTVSPSEYCTIRISFPSTPWISKKTRAVIVNALSFPLILGMPFLQNNNLLIDASRAALHALNMQLIRAQKRDVLRELQLRFREQPFAFQHTLPTPPSFPQPMEPTTIACAIRTRIEELALNAKLARENEKMREKFKDRFPDDIPPIHHLPTDVYHRFRLKDPNMVIVKRTYDCPKKYREVWR